MQIQAPVADINNLRQLHTHLACRRLMTRPWWREAVFYHVFPLSFADSNGDDYGNLDRVVSRLDYLSDIFGVDAISMSPFFTRPLEVEGVVVSHP